MSDDRKRPHSFKMRLSDCEQELLEFMHDRTGLTMADFIREAVWTYSREHASFDRRRFNEHASEVCEELADSARASFFKSQLTMLVGNLDGPTRPGPLSKRVRSEAKSFEEE